MSDDAPKGNYKDFRDQILQGFWLDLKVHLERGAIIVVHPDLDMSEVGFEVAADNVAKIQTWIDEQLLARPTAEQLAEWNDAQAKEFRFLIAQPYVLIQEVESSLH